MYGIVKWWNDKAGYGFITAKDADGGFKDYFAHYNRILSNQKFKKLKDGWVVSFTPDVNEKGFVADDIRRSDYESKDLGDIRLHLYNQEV